MDFRIPIHFRSGCLKNASPHPLGQPQTIDCPHHRGLDRLNRVVLVMDRRGGTSHVVYAVHLHFKRINHIVAHQLKVGMIFEVSYILFVAGKEIVETDYLVTLIEQTLA